MKRTLLTTVASAFILSAAPAFAGLSEDVAADYPYVFDLYKHFHENPELSFKEEKTSARMAEELTALGFDVTTRVGDAWVQKKVNAVHRKSSGSSTSVFQPFTIA